MSLAGHFSKVFRNGFLIKPNFLYSGGCTARHSSIWEPDYLIFAKTKTPEYDLVNIQIKGYDFAVLEKYQKLIKNIATQMKINIVKSWPAPQQDLVIHHYKMNSTDIEHKYDLSLRERNVQIVDVKSHILPLFIEAIITACPPCVTLSVHQHEDHMEEYRYVPNFEVLELQEELENVGSELKKKKKMGKKKGLGY